MKAFPQMKRVTVNPCFYVQQINIYKLLTVWNPVIRIYKHLMDTKIKTENFKFTTLDLGIETVIQ